MPAAIAPELTRTTDAPPSQRAQLLDERADVVMVDAAVGVRERACSRPSRRCASSRSSLHRLGGLCTSRLVLDERDLGIRGQRALELERPAGDADLVAVDGAGIR